MVAHIYHIQYIYTRMHAYLQICRKDLHRLPQHSRLARTPKMWNRSVQNLMQNKILLNCLVQGWTVATWSFAMVCSCMLPKKLWRLLQSLYYAHLFSCITQSRGNIPQLTMMSESTTPEPLTSGPSCQRTMKTEAAKGAEGQTGRHKDKQ